MFIATLIAKESLNERDIQSAIARLGEAGVTIARQSGLIDGRVLDIFFNGDPGTARKYLEEIDGDIDVAVQPEANRLKKLLISDMDSTMITVECIDELADYAGIKSEIAAITERAMQGELDFEEALRGRVALLKGLETAAIQLCLDERVRIMPGAETLVRTMARVGATTILVSGGFTKFAKPVAQVIGFESFHANVLGESSGLLTGGLDGPIVDSARKDQLLQSAAQDGGLSLQSCLAVGDGANDIPMLQRAGLGVAYHAKPKAAQAADVAIRYNDLTALLYIQGIAADQWVSQ
ncbi:phosphoserine phosphatase SerB [Sphingorhabdus sp. YGSMI21]|uniref:phosphoserine phosphatase SerB n=1 Tax=Sphingorhabdus sp. YGSMI21 TaxID=2077182 RepID=UPI000C1E9899|nr:phosphoserine phosphatase SerB [Sphingorhabdus sp. YGSMI21]ATW04827.1 phosphoserine phosphatase SerB [Sphingorhabdus sp. YGSMI21]